MSEPSYAAVEDYMFGHRAYNGMNPEIEKMTQAEEQVNISVHVSYPVLRLFFYWINGMRKF